MRLDPSLWLKSDSRNGVQVVVASPESPGYACRMIHAENTGADCRVRKQRSVTEKLEIVELTMDPGASVAEIARAHGVNSDLVFKWRRMFKKG